MKRLVFCWIAQLGLLGMSCGADVKDDADGSPDPVDPPYPECKCPPSVDPTLSLGEHIPNNESGLIEFGDFPSSWISVESMDIAGDVVKVTFFTEDGNSLTATYNIVGAAAAASKQ